MNEIGDFFKGLFDHDKWPPRWQCGEWSAFHGWLYIISDLLIWSAYFTIPVIILYYVSKRSGARFYNAYFYFAAFILLCGLTHFVDALVFWIPIYRFGALLRFFTALVSWATVYQLFKMLPIAFSLKSQESLEVQLQAGDRMRRELEDKNAQLLRQNKFIETILDSSDSFISVFGLRTEFLAVNKQAELRMGQSRAELLGQLLIDVMPETRDSEYRIALNAALKGEIISRQYIVVDNLHYECSFIPLYEAENQYAVLAISRDVTDRVRRERELNRANEELNAQNKQLHQMNNELEQYAYILSHDLQEPLRKIQTYSSLALQEQDRAKAHNFLERVESSATRMRRLITDVLEYSRLRDGESRANVDLNEVLHDVKTDLELVIRERGVNLEVDPLPTILGVRHQFYQLFMNLLGNAIKYNHRIPNITIHTSIATPQQVSRMGVDPSRQYHFITVSDNGDGFDPRFNEDVFTLFKRLESNVDGSGIGLALCRKVLMAHGGQIMAESVPGVGSTFSMLIPL